MLVLIECNLFFPHFSPCDSKMRFVTAIFPLLSPQMPRYFKGCDRCDSKTHTITGVYTRARPTHKLRTALTLTIFVHHLSQHAGVAYKSVYFAMCVCQLCAGWEFFFTFSRFFSLFGALARYISIEGAVRKYAIKPKRTDWGSILLSRQNPVRDIARVSP